MNNELIEVPEIKFDSLYYLLADRVYFDDREIYNGCYPLIRKEIDMKSGVYTYLLKFIYKTNYDDPLEPLHKIMKKHPKLSYDRFITRKENIKIPTKEGHLRNLKRLYKMKVSYEHIIDYWIINESIVTYLKNKAPKSKKEIEEIRLLFSNINKGNIESIGDTLGKKAKYLLDLHLTPDILNEQLKSRGKLR